MVSIILYGASLPFKSYLQIR